RDPGLARPELLLQPPRGVHPEVPAADDQHVRDLRLVTAAVHQPVVPALGHRISALKSRSPPLARAGEIGKSPLTCMSLFCRVRRKDGYALAQAGLANPAFACAFFHKPSTTRKASPGEV